MATKYPPRRRKYAFGIDEDRFWYDDDGHLHKEDGPAATFVDGSTYWLRHGTYHREDGPAINIVGDKEYWYINGRELDPLEIFLIQGKQKG